MYLIKHPSIKGDFSIENHKYCIRIWNISFGIFRRVNQITGNQKRNIGLLEYKELSFIRKMDIYKVNLENEIFSGDCNDCEVVFINNNNSSFSLYLTNAIFSYYHMEKECITGQSIEHITLNYTDIVFRKIK